MRSDLRTISSNDQRLDFFPVFSIQLQAYSDGRSTKEKFLMLIFTPAAVGFVLSIGVVHPHN